MSPEEKFEELCKFEILLREVLRLTEGNLLSNHAIKTRMISDLHMAQRQIKLEKQKLTE